MLQLPGFSQAEEGRRRFYGRLSFTGVALSDKNPDFFFIPIAMNSLTSRFRSGFKESLQVCTQSRALKSIFTLKSFVIAPLPAGLGLGCPQIPNFSPQNTWSRAGWKKGNKKIPGSGISGKSGIKTSQDWEFQGNRESEQSEKFCPHLVTLSPLTNGICRG